MKWGALLCIFGFLAFCSVLDRGLGWIPDIWQKCSSKNEEFQQCGSSCPETCANHKNPEPKSCAAVCFVGCVCKPGFIRDDLKGSICVKPEDCSK
uniref:Venom peptide SjAPI n=1 Tax=Scorpiops jendeki TaxID=587368 RepID=TIL1_SCOJE|nr:RecName: Full=Venom peptide SjAPI; AltName: Full=Ascaris-type protease inhibitor; Flags: Precursor [Scorpiops jendeki]